MKVTGRLSDPNSLGRILSQGRLLSGLTQKQLAAELGVSQRYISEIETGKHSKFAERLFAYAAATGVTLFAELEYEPESDSDTQVSDG